MMGFSFVPLLILMIMTVPTMGAAFLPTGENRGKTLAAIKRRSLSCPSPFPLHFSSESSRNEQLSVVGVVAPLNYQGPYACLGLNFPNIVSKTKGEEKVVSINFILDTGANVNTISKDLATDLDLTTVVRKQDLSILGSAGAGGEFEAGDIVLLGDCQLAGMPEEQPKFTFMTNLTAAAIDLGMAQSFSGGLLGTSFFECFPAGVEFDWYGTDGDPPTIIFYYGNELPDDAKKNCFCVPLDEDSFFGVPTTIANVNGVDLLAIIDTGSPISIVSSDAAKDIGIEKHLSSGHENDVSPRLKIKGVDAGTVDLDISSNAIPISIGGMSFGSIDHIFIGNLPGINAAGTFLNFPQPRALIGLDVLRRAYRMILRVPKKELWFQPLPKGD